MTFEILVIFALLLLNGFFALSEMAIISASKPLLQEYARQGRRSAVLALELKDKAGRFLSTVQVGITLVGIMAGAYGGARMAEKLSVPLDSIALIYPHGEAVAVVLIVTAITYFSVVIGELVPKKIALNNSEKLAMFVARPMYYLSLACTPLVIIFEQSAKILIRLMRIRATDKGVTEIEIKAVLAEGVASGAIESSEQKLMSRVIRLGDRDVKSIMTHRNDVMCINIEDNLAEVRRKITEAGHSRYPVVGGDHSVILGIIRTKDMMPHTVAEQDFKVHDYLKEIVFMDENTPCLEALDRFRQERIHIAAVMDEYNAFEGIFTTSDLLEAIVGMMPSNYDRDEAPHIVQRQDGSWLVDGMTSIDEIQMTIGLDIAAENSDYKTIAGFMLANMKLAPQAGVSFQVGDYRFEIMDMDKYRIDKILISPSLGRD